MEDRLERFFDIHKSINNFTQGLMQSAEILSAFVLVAVVPFVVATAVTVIIVILLIVANIITIPITNPRFRTVGWWRWWLSGGGSGSGGSCSRVFADAV